MKKKYKYDAFISYRHGELDKFVAENLHKKLESYKIPKNLLKSGKLKSTKIQRVFRDMDELPLTSNLEEPIVQALQQSKYLLVICTPRLKESMWCQKEIETFISMHGRERVFAVLAEGEPKEVLPKEILYKEAQVINSDGTIDMELVPVEPLAADVRGNTKKEVLKAMDVEMLRLLAPMFGVEFDDLKQRHRERKLHNIIKTTVAAGLLCFGIGIASTIAALHINKQKDKIEKQAEAIQEQNDMLIKNQAQNLARESTDHLEKGDRRRAVETAVAALTEYQGVPMVYTPEARYALFESLYHYDNGGRMKPVSWLEMSGLVYDYVLSPNKELVACIDMTGEIGVWNLANQKKIITIPEIAGVNDTYIRNIAFCDNECLVCIRGGNQLCKVNVNTGETVSSIVIEGLNELYSDGDKYVAVSVFDGINICDVSGEQITIVDEIMATNGYLIEWENLYFQQGQLLFVEGFLGNTDYYNEDEESIQIETIINLYDCNMKEKQAQIEEYYNCITAVNLKEENIYYAICDFDDYDENCVVKKYNIRSEETLWSIPVDAYVLNIYFPEEDDGAILLAEGSGLKYVDKDSGNIIVNKEIPETLVYVEGIEGTADYAMLSHAGMYSRFYVNIGEIVGNDDSLVKYASNIETFIKTANGYLVQIMGDNKLIYYERTEGRDKAPYEGEYTNHTGIMEEDLAAVATEYNISKAGILNTVMYTDDKKLMFASYNDRTVEIYDSDTKELLNTLEGLPSICVYYGADKEGNRYISNHSYGYILDSECNLIGKIESMTGIDPEGERIFIDYDNQRYVFPMYSLEEMIEMGKEIIN